MIEKFTPEELEQIKKELGMKSNNYSKSKLTTSLYDKFSQIEKIDEDSKEPLVSNALSKAVIKICDHTFRNYHLDDYYLGYGKERFIAGKRYKISRDIPYKNKDEYVEFAFLLADLIVDKYKKNKESEDK